MARLCTVCTHPARASIEVALHQGTSLRLVASQYGLGKDALANHHNQHQASEDLGDPLTPAVAIDDPKVDETRQDEWAAFFQLLNAPLQEPTPPTSRAKKATTESSVEPLFGGRPYDKEDVQKFLLDSSHFKPLGWESVKRYFVRRLQAAGIPDPLIPAVIKVIKEVISYRDRDGQTRQLE